MNRETAALIHHAQSLAAWAAEQVVATDALIVVAGLRPLSPSEQRDNLRMQRELLVRLSQRDSLVEWALESQAVQRMAAQDDVALGEVDQTTPLPKPRRLSWWQHLWRRLRRG